MKNKLFIGFILVVLLFVGIAGCTSSSSTSGNTPTPTQSPVGPSVTAAPTAAPTISPNDPLIGTWTAPLGEKTLKWTFYNDGSARYDNGTIEILPPNSWTRLDDLHYKVAGKILTSNLTFDLTHTTFSFTVLPSVTFKKA